MLRYKYIAQIFLYECLVEGPVQITCVIFYWKEPPQCTTTADLETEASG